jgi:hypothetical protein
MDVVVYARKVNSEFHKNFVCEIPTSAEDNYQFSAILNTYRKYFQKLIMDARSAGIEEILIEQTKNSI